ncbi:hypothetical protein Q8V57_003338 [Vibrio cholerae]|nr:hypothetical protein [Vibrio cholerae]
MNKTLSIIALSVLSGCSTMSFTENQEPVNVYEIGSKANAKFAIDFIKIDESAYAGYRKNKLTVYVSSLPSQAEFSLCSKDEEPTGCASGISVWQNQIHFDPETLWISYDIHFYTGAREAKGEALKSNNVLQGEVALKLGESKVLASYKSYSGDDKNVENQLVVVARNL